MQQIADTKNCSICGVKKPANIKYFYKRSSSKDGLTSTCKECTSQFYKKYRKANPEKCNTVSKKYRKANPEKCNTAQKKWRKANPEKVKAYSKKWQKANPEKCMAASKKYYESNPEKYKATVKKYREDNPEKIKTYHKKWQSTARGIFTVMKANKHDAWKFTFEEFDQWYKSQPGTCCYCDITAENYHKLPWRKNKLTTRLSLDRIEPSLFYEPNNVKLCCLDCNSTKSNFFTYDEMREIAQKYIKPKWQKELDVLQ